MDRSESLKAFVAWQAQGMLRNSIADVEHFCKRFIELDSNGRVWKDKVYVQLIEELLQSYVFLRFLYTQSWCH